MKKVNVSSLSIKYFAELVDRYTIQNLRRFDDYKKYFYILCFVYYRYIKINDNLIKTFLFFVDKYQNEVKRTIEQKILELRIENSKNLKKGADILRLLTNASVANEDIREKAFNILTLKQINQLANFLEKSDIDFESLRWQEYDSKFHVIKSNLRHILKSLKFTTNSKKNSENVLKAVEFLQSYCNSNSRKMIDSPIDFIPTYLHKYFYKKCNGKKTIIEYRYEIFVYRKLRKMIGNSNIFIPDSTKYCSLEGDLKDKEEFEKNVVQICNDLGTEFLTEDLEKRLKNKLSEIDNLLI